MKIEKCHRCKNDPMLSQFEIESPNPDLKNPDGTFGRITMFQILCEKCSHDMMSSDRDKLIKDWNYWEIHFMYINHAHSIASDATELVKEKLEEFEIQMTEKLEEEIYEFLSDKLEELSNGEYSSYN